MQAVLWLQGIWKYEQPMENCHSYLQLLVFLLWLHRVSSCASQFSVSQQTMQIPMQIPVAFFFF